MMEQQPVLTFHSPPLPYFLECGKTNYTPGQSHPNRKNIGVFDLLLVEKGQLYIGEEDKQWVVSERQILILLPNRYHYSVKPCTETTRFFWVHFQTTERWDEIERSESFDLPLPAQDEGHFSHINPFLIKIPKYQTLSYPKQAYTICNNLIRLSTQPRSSAFWQQQQLIFELFRSMNEVQSDHYPSSALEVAERTEAFIKQNYQLPITNAMLSNALHFHYNYISRCMKKIYGLTPMAFLHHYRIEQAKLLLLKTEWPITYIAEQVGFHQVAYFSRSFSKKVGISPARFRKRFSNR